MGSGWQFNREELCVVLIKSLYVTVSSGKDNVILCTDNLRRNYNFFQSEMQSLVIVDACATHISPASIIRFTILSCHWEGYDMIRVRMYYNYEYTHIGLPNGATVKCRPYHQDIVNSIPGGNAAIHGRESKRAQLASHFLHVASHYGHLLAAVIEFTPAFTSRYVKLFSTLH